MVKIFVYQIKCGRMSVDDVPERWLEEVKKEMENG